MFLLWPEGIERGSIALLASTCIYLLLHSQKGQHIEAHTAESVVKVDSSRCGWVNETIEDEGHDMEVS